MQPPLFQGYPKNELQVFVVTHIGLFRHGASLWNFAHDMLDSKLLDKPIASHAVASVFTDAFIAAYITVYIAVYIAVHIAVYIAVYIAVHIAVYIAVHQRASWRLVGASWGQV